MSPARARVAAGLTAGACAVAAFLLLLLGEIWIGVFTGLLRSHGSPAEIRAGEVFLFLALGGAAVGSFLVSRAVYRGLHDRWSDVPRFDRVPFWNTRRFLGPF